MSKNETGNNNNNSDGSKDKTKLKEKSVSGFFDSLEFSSIIGSNAVPPQDFVWNEHTKVGIFSLLAALLIRFQEQLSAAVIDHLYGTQANLQSTTRMNAEGYESHFFQFPRNCSFYHSFIHSICKCTRFSVSL